MPTKAQPGHLPSPFMDRATKYLWQSSEGIWNPRTPSTAQRTSKQHACKWALGCGSKRAQQDPKLPKGTHSQKDMVPVGAFLFDPRTHFFRTGMAFPTSMQETVRPSASKRGISLQTAVRRPVSTLAHRLTVIHLAPSGLAPNAFYVLTFGTGIPCWAPHPANGVTRTHRTSTSGARDLVG